MYIDSDTSRANINETRFGMIARLCGHPLKSHSMMRLNRIPIGVMTREKPFAAARPQPSRATTTRGLPRMPTASLSIAVPGDRACLERLRYELAGRGIAFTFVADPIMRVVIQVPAMEQEDIADLVASIAERSSRRLS